MIKLYRKNNCQQCDDFQEKLENMVISFQIFPENDKTAMRQANLNPKDLPVLIENDSIFKGNTAVLRQIEKLEKLKSDWDLIQGDSCYCGSDGDIL